MASTKTPPGRQPPKAHLPPAPLPRSERVLLVDFINPLDFPKAGDLLGPAWQAAQATARLKARLVRQGCAVIYANDNYGVWHSEFRDILSHCCALPGMRGEMARLLAPAPQDLVLLKPRHSAFHSTPLQYLLSQMQARELVVTGLATDICVQFTASDALMHGYDVWIPSDCTAAENDEWKDAALRHMQRVLRCSTRQGSRA